MFGDVYYNFDIKQHQHYKILYDYFITGKLNGFYNETGQIVNAIACHLVVETECIRGIIKKLLKFDMEKCCTEVDLTFEDLFERTLANQIVRYAKSQGSKYPNSYYGFTTSEGTKGEPCIFLNNIDNRVYFH